MLSGQNDDASVCSFSEQMTEAGSIHNGKGDALESRSPENRTVRWKTSRYEYEAQANQSTFKSNAGRPTEL